MSRRSTPLCWEQQLKKEEDLKRALRAEKAVVSRKEEKYKELLRAEPYTPTRADAARRVIIEESGSTDTSAIKRLEKRLGALFEDYCGRHAFVSLVGVAAASPQQAAELLEQGKPLALHSVEFLWNVFSQTITVGLKPVALPEEVGIYSRLPRP